jgi:glutathione synthase/RimK-type ligase-like ATP-grasp enzyme
VPVGAISRVAAKGEWRTNVNLGGTRVRVDPPPGALALAVWAAAAAGIELVGVDLLPDGEGGWTVLELNGAVDFTSEYQIDRDPFVAAMSELARVLRERQASVLPVPVVVTGAEGAA